MEKTHEKEWAADKAERFEVEEEVTAGRPRTATSKLNAVGQDAEGVPRCGPPRFRE
jgi:hypothetical protein